VGPNDHGPDSIGWELEVGDLPRTVAELLDVHAHAVQHGDLEVAKRGARLPFGQFELTLPLCHPQRWKAWMVHFTTCRLL
jgi:hypothetical protein